MLVTNVFLLLFEFILFFFSAKCSFSNNENYSILDFGCFNCKSRFPVASKATPPFTAIILLVLAETFHSGIIFITHFLREILRIPLQHSTTLLLWVTITNRIFQVLLNFSSFGRRIIFFSENGIPNIFFFMTFHCSIPPFLIQWKNYRLRVWFNQLINMNEISIILLNILNERLYTFFFLNKNHAAWHSTSAWKQILSKAIIFTLTLPE